MSSSGWNEASPIEQQIAEEIIESSQAMVALGEKWAKRWKPGVVIALYGTLGTGKTTFVKGLAKGLGAVSSIEEVMSPTFTYLHIYEGGEIPFYHFDLYRLRGPEDFLSLSFDDFLEREGICCIEWPERMASLLPVKHDRLVFEHIAPHVRRLALWERR